MLAGAPLVAFVAAADLDRADAFYAGVLGLRRLDSSPYARVYDAAGTTLRVTRTSGVRPADHTVLGWAVADVHATLDALRARGVEPRRYDGLTQDAAGVWTAPSGARVAWFVDPDGNVLSLTEPPGAPGGAPGTAPGGAPGGPPPAP